MGIIQDKKQNVLHVYDEADKHTDRLYYLFDDDAWHVGDRVSVDYSLDTHVIQRIKRMTPVQYNKEGKNCGFIHGRPI